MASIIYAFHAEVNINRKLCFKQNLGDAGTPPQPVAFVLGHFLVRKIFENDSFPIVRNFLMVKL